VGARRLHPHKHWPDHPKQSDRGVLRGRAVDPLSPPDVRVSAAAAHALTRGRRLQTALGSDSRAASEHQKIDHFQDGNRLTLVSGRCFNRHLPLMELRIRNEHQRRIGAGSCPLGELAETGSSWLPNLLSLSEDEPAGFEDLDSIPNRRKLLTNRSRRGPKPKQGREIRPAGRRTFRARGRGCPDGGRDEAH
jgi:hypothetical protein